MSFLRHREIYQVETRWRGRNRDPARAFDSMSLQLVYSLASCSPAEPASLHQPAALCNMARPFATSNSPLSLYHLISCLTLGAHPNFSN